MLCAKPVYVTPAQDPFSISFASILFICHISHLIHIQNEQTKKNLNAHFSFQKKNGKVNEFTYRYSYSSSKYLSE